MQTRENTTKAQRVLSIAVVFILFAARGATARDVKIVANPEVKVDSISTSELKSVFLAERQSLRDGSHAEPVFQQGGPAHQAFLREYLGKSDGALQDYYGGLVFTGKASMPKSFRSDAEVVAYVARTRGAIGYVSPAASAEGVRILVVISEGGKSERMLITRVSPEYPETLRRLKIGGTVRLAVTISAQGRVEDVQLLGGNPILGESAVTAVRQWVYALGRSQTVVQVSVPFDPEH